MIENLEGWYESMLDRFYYVSHDGKYRVDFGENGIYVCESDVRGYKWEHKLYNEQITAFSKSVDEKELPLLFIGKTQKDVYQKRDAVFQMFEYDVRKKKPGRIWINGYYIDCYVTEAANSGYIYPRHILTKFTLLKVGDWHKVTEISFFKTSGSGGDTTGIDYPLDYSFDYVYASSNPWQTIDNDVIAECDFILTIYGPCTNPEIEIAGHKYKVLGTIQGTERVVVQSVSGVDRSIYIVAQDGTAINWFGHRYKEESIFEKIPAGKNLISWDGTFGFDLHLIESRSEPKWDNILEEDRVPIENDDYLVDSNGSYIVDSKYLQIRLGA